MPKMSSKSIRGIWDYQCNTRHVSLLRGDKNVYLPTLAPEPEFFFRLPRIHQDQIRPGIHSSSTYGALVWPGGVLALPLMSLTEDSLPLNWIKQPIIWHCGIWHTLSSWHLWTVSSRTNCLLTSKLARGQLQRLTEVHAQTPYLLITFSFVTHTQFR